MFFCLFSSNVNQKHDPPTSSIPCLHYKKMKEQEEKEVNGEATPSTDESPVKPRQEANGEDGEGKPDAAAEDPDGVSPSALTDAGPDGEGAADNGRQAKESQPCDTAQGALGQVKAKVEVCKDESIGKDCHSRPVALYCVIRLFDTEQRRSVNPPPNPQNSKTSACTWKNASTSNRSP